MQILPKISAQGQELCGDKGEISAKAKLWGTAGPLSKFLQGKTEKRGLQWACVQCEGHMGCVLVTPVEFSAVIEGETPK